MAAGLDKLELCCQGSKELAAIVEKQLAQPLLRYSSETLASSADGTAIDLRAARSNAA
jgi:hypothetical protein